MTIVTTLFEEGKERLTALRKERLDTGHMSPAELYWGGYVDALCQARSVATESDLDWAWNGTSRLMSKTEVISRLNAEIVNCTACVLQSTRKQTVSGTGPLWTPLMIIGEAPGAEEDASGIPFVGKSGRLFFDSDGLLSRCTGYTREHVRIANVTRCRPPGNRNPSPEEVCSCSRFLRQEILTVAPKVILCLGKTAASWFIGRDTRIGDVRGTPWTWEGITVLATFHPAYALREPSATAEIEKDLAQLVKSLNA